MIDFVDGFANQSGEVLVYLFDQSSGEHLGKALIHVSEGCGLAPGQTQDIPPKAKLGFAVVRVDDQWNLLEDHRGTVYRKADGGAFSLSEFGAIPEELTTEPRPSKHHRWNGSVWALDSGAKAKEERQVASMKARAYLTMTDWYVIRQHETGEPIPEDVMASRATARTEVIAGDNSNV